MAHVLRPEQPERQQSSPPAGRRIARSFHALIPDGPHCEVRAVSFSPSKIQRSSTMCSILGVFDLRPGADLQGLRPLALSLSARQRHRGPDWSGVYGEPRCLLVHERLAIVDPAGGAQPLRSADGRLALAVNGEIYNHRELERSLAAPYD